MAENKMKIGLLCNFYGFPQYTERCLKAWKNIDEVYKVAVSSYQYKDYVDCGWNFDDTETPKQLLSDHRGFIDYICIGKDANDSYSRNAPLQHLLANNVDFVWLLDQDEFYSEEDIRGAINYIKNSEKVPTYKINFKNFVFSEDQYVDDFNPPRIFCANVNGQKTLSHFFYENDVMYNIDNKFIEYKELPISSIPKEDCHPDHFSWVGSPEFLQAKVRYQLKRYNGICSYKWDYSNNCLAFNEDFFSKFNQEKPIIKKL